VRIVAPGATPPASTPRESRSGLAPWSLAALPAPPDIRGTRVLAVLGPGTILLGASIGSGEWLIGPAAFVKYGLALLWVTTVAVLLQTVLNTELVRYALYTGEPATVGFMRTRPGPKFWAAVYGGLTFLQYGWPGWAGAAAGAIFFLSTQRMPSSADAGALYAIGVGTFAVCVLILVFGGKRIGRTLELLNWAMIAAILAALVALCVAFGEPSAWLATLGGFVGFDTRAGRFAFLPPGADWFLIGAFAAYSGMGGMGNVAVSNYARDKGYGMGGVVGFISAAVGGQQVKLPHSGSVFAVSAESLLRWRGWWRIVRLDQWGVFCVGAMLGMGLPAILYTSFLGAGGDIRGLAVAAELANAMAARGGAAMGFLVAMMSVWVLFKTQLDVMEVMVRTVTDILWCGSSRVRAWRHGDVRVVYYSVLAFVAVWGVTALALTQPIFLLQLGANVAGLAFVVASLHILYLNTRLLPPELRPPLWRRLALGSTAVFYGFFSYLWLMGGLLPDPQRGFLFTTLRHLGWG
jgi:hypothetical protein